MGHRETEDMETVRQGERGIERRETGRHENGRQKTWRQGDRKVVGVVWGS